MSRLSTLDLREKKKKGEKIAMLTAYDYPTASLVEKGGGDMILVGDSLGMVVLGFPNTLPVTIDHMIHHGKAVVRGTHKALVVVDMPFLTYQISKEEAIRNAGRIIQETGCQGVKLEGGLDILETVKGITEAGIPVMGHLGLTPQSVGQMGGFRVQGRDVASGRKILEEALALEEAGAFSLVLECVPWPLAQIISERLDIPTIGIGAGPYCDGQVLVFHDITGLYAGKRPKFAKQYVDGDKLFSNSIAAYVREVKEAQFPGKEHSFDLPPDVLEGIIAEQP